MILLYIFIFIWVKADLLCRVRQCSLPPAADGGPFVVGETDVLVRHTSQNQRPVPEKAQIFRQLPGGVPAEKAVVTLQKDSPRRPAGSEKEDLDLLSAGNAVAEQWPVRIVLR